MKLRLPNLLEINLSLSFLFLLSCNTTPTNNLDSEEKASNSIQLYGNTQGTTYSIICNDSIDITHQEVDEILHQFDLALSTYIEESTISQLNTMGGGQFSYSDKFNYFNRCYKETSYIYEKTNGLFDPTIFPLIDSWGFYNKNHQVPDSTVIDSLNRYVGFSRNHFNYLYGLDSLNQRVPKNIIIKNTPQAKLDFNGIAQGLAVDILAEFLETKGAINYFVEIGGEIRVSGKNAENVNWRIGIDKPIENSDANNREIMDIIHLTNTSVATSGSYRNFFESEGKSYSHTIDPKTGYPVMHKLISATVVTEKCSYADALATACMVMGPDETINYFENDTIFNAGIYLIYENNKGRILTYYNQKFAEYFDEETFTN